MAFDILDYAVYKKLAEKGGSSVTVEPLNVTENGTYTAPTGKAYSPVTVDVPQPSGSISITENGTVDVTDYESAVVNVPAPTPSYQSKSVTPSTSAQNITADTGYDALSSVNVSAITKELLATLDADFVADNIKKDVDLFGLVGTFAGGGVTNAKIFDITLSSDITASGDYRTKIYSTDPDIASQISNENLVIFICATSIPTTKPYCVILGASANKAIAVTGSSNTYGSYICYNNSAATTTGRVGGGNN